MTNPVSNDLCRLLFETAADAILVMQNGQIVDFNPAAEALFGQKKLAGKHLLDLAPPSQPNGSPSTLVWQEKFKAAAAGQPQHFELVVQSTEKRAIFAHASLSILGFSGQTYAQLSLRDITERSEIENALRDSQRRLTDIINFLPEGTFVIDMEGKLLAWNKAMEEMTGIKAEDVLGKGDYEYALPFYGKRRPILANMAMQPSQEIAKNYPFIERDGESYVTEVQTPYFLRKGGATVWAKARPLYDAHGNMVGAIESVRDITERKKAEEELRASEARLRAFVNALPDVAFIHNADGRYLEILVSENNTRYARIKETLKGKFIHNVASPEQADLFVATIKQALATGNPQILEYSLKNGVWYEGRVLPIKTDSAESDRVVWLAREITGRKQLEQQIQASLERRGRLAQISSEISQEIATLASQEELYRRVVISINEQFNLYNTQLFLFDAQESHLKLTAAYGQPGKVMMEQGYQVALGQGMVGQAALFGSAVLEPDLSTEANWQPHPALPMTKGQLSIPIRLGQQNAQTQAAALQGFIDQEFAGFIVCGIDKDAVAPVTNRAVQRGLTVVSQSVDLGQDAQTFYVGAEEFEAGYTLGLQAGEWANSHLKSGQTMQAGILNHRAAVPDREKGIIAGLKAIAPNVEIVANEFGPNPLVSQPVAEQWLKTWPNLKMILGINDAGALGAYQAVKSAGKNRAGEFFIGGVDGVEEALVAISEGGAYQASVDKTAGAEALACLNALLSGISGQPCPPRVVIETKPINRTNFGRFLNADYTQAFEELWPDADFGGIKIGLSVMTLNNPFFAEMARLISGQAKRLGLDLVLHEPRPVLGVLSVQSDTPNTLDAEDQLALEGIVGQVAVALEKNRLLDEAGIFRQFAEATGQGFGIGSLDGKTAYMNPALLQALDETSLEDVLGKSIFDYYPESAQQLLAAQILPTVMQKGQWAGETTIRTRRGKKFPAIQNIFLIHNEEGVPLYIANVLTNITERKQAEAELETRLQEYDALQRLTSREAWQSYLTAQETGIQGYLFDELSVQPVETLQNRSGNGQALTRPVSVRGEVIGTLGVLDSAEHPIDPEEREFLDSVAEQVAEALERARLLEQTQKRAVELEAVAQVGTVAATVPDVDELLQTVADLTKTSFNLYHAHIYLVNQTGSRLNLVAGAGDVGRKMVQQGWHISTDKTDSIVIKAFNSRRGVITNDVRKLPAYLPNPLLPETLSEMAVPLIAGKTVLGVLNVQANIAGRFTEDDVRIKTTLAAQIAVALQNANQYQQTQAALVEVEATQRRYTVQAWEAYRDRIPEKHFEQVREGVVSVQQELPAGVDEAVKEKQPALVSLAHPPDSESGTAGESNVIVPLTVRNEVIGVLGLQDSDTRNWTTEEVALVQAVAEQMAQAAENLRLLDETQQRVSRERRLNEIGEKIQASQSLEEALQIAVKEVGLSLQSSHTSVKLDTQ